MPVIQRQVAACKGNIIGAPLAVCQEVGWMVVNTKEKKKLLLCVHGARIKMTITVVVLSLYLKGWVSKIEYPLSVDYSEQK